MAEFVFQNPFFTINGVDLKDHVRAVTLKADRDIFEKTAMGSNTKSRLAGLKDWSLDVEFNQDFAAAKVDATLFPIWDNGTSVAFVLRPDAGVKGATNPEFGGNMVLPSYSPVSGSVGQGATVKVTFQANGDLSRATA